MLEACLSVALGPAKLAGLISMVACVTGGGLQKEQRALRRSRGPSLQPVWYAIVTWASPMIMLILPNGHTFPPTP